MDNPPADPPAIPPVIEGAPATAARVVSQGFKDSQRAMSLKWAIHRGAHKDGTAVSDEDKAFFASWTAAHPPKAPKASTRTERAPDPDYDVPDGEQPRMTAPPKADPDPPKAKKGDKGSAKPATGWQAKYKMKVAVPGLEGLTALEEREMLCVQGAALVCGVVKAAEDGLALIGAKPYFGLTTDQVFGAWVLTLDKALPDLKLEPEHIAIFGTVAICAPALLNIKRIREAKANQKAGKDRDTRLEDMKRRTAKAEQEDQERRQREADAEAAARASAKPEPPPPAPEAEPSAEWQPRPSNAPPPESRPPVEGPRVSVHQKHETVDPMFAQEWET